MMSRSHLRAAGFVLVALFAFPRPGNAGLIDFIWGMSGPQMFSWVTFDCEFAVKNAKPECRVYDIRIIGDAGVLRAERNLWVILNASAYTSTGGTTESTKKFVAFENHMIGIDPALRFKSNPRLRHGVGFTYNHLWGSDFKTFDKLGIKFEPISVPVNIYHLRSDVTFTIRFYPDGFTSQQFGLAGTPDPDRKHEWAFGATWEIR